MSNHAGKPVDVAITPEALRPAEPFQMFDELYYMGSKIVGIYALKTGEGLVLLDATDNVNAYEEIVRPSLEKLGLAGEKILAVLLTHGHFDHYLGAESIRKATGCKVGLSIEDTAYMAWSYENMARHVDPVIPRITKILNDGEELTYGDHTVYVMKAPGHTPGCLNFSFEVHDRGEAHRVLLFGGYGVFGPGCYPDNGGQYPYGVQWGVDNALIFAGACVKTWEYCKAHNCDVYLNPHPHLCGLYECAEDNKNRKDGDPNGYVIGLENVRKWLVERFDACIRSAQKFTDIQQEYHG